MAAAVSAVFSLHSLPTRTTSIASRERVKFNKVSLLHRNVSSGAKAVSIRAQDTTKNPVTSKDSEKNFECVLLNKDTPENTHSCQCLISAKITGNDAPAEVWHIIINTDGKIPYKEGQYVGVIPDGGTPNLYSIASSARGDLGSSKTVSLCVKRAFRTNDRGQIVPGDTSNFLCDLIPGDKVTLTGAGGTEMLMPKEPNATIIMLATETGIAPFRSFCWKLFYDYEQHNDHKFNGRAWLFFGVPTSSSLLYEEEFKRMKDVHPDNLSVDYAVGEKMNIPNRMGQYEEELWELIKKDDTYVYMSGNKDMEPDIEKFMVYLAAKHGEAWSDIKKMLRKEGRWNVEVY